MTNEEMIDQLAALTEQNVRLQAEVVCEEARFRDAHEQIAELEAYNATRTAEVLAATEQAAALAKQNALLREALKFARSQTEGEGSPESDETCDCVICEALALSDLSTSILAKLDAKVLRGATKVMSFGCDAKLILNRMADELEAKAKETK